MSQESNTSIGSKLNLSLSQETVDYMFNSLGDMANTDDVWYISFLPSDRYQLQLLNICRHTVGSYLKTKVTGLLITKMQ